jgi:RHS repeat-associated protein
MEPETGLTLRVCAVPRPPVELGRPDPCFSGEYRGLYHPRARQYDPASGRFLTRDPLPIPPGTHTISAYSYVGNRPIVFVDPSGKVGFRCGICEAAEAFAEGVRAGTEAVVSGVTHAVGTGAEAAREVASFATDQVVRAKKWVETHQTEIACGLAVGGGVVLMGSWGVAGGVLITRGLVPLLAHGLRHRGLETAAAVAVTGGFVIEHRADRGIPCFS